MLNRDGTISIVTAYHGCRDAARLPYLLYAFLQTLFVSVGQSRRLLTFELPVGGMIALNNLI